MYWTPEPAWLGAGLVLGPACGAVVGTALSLPGDGVSFADAVLLGGFWGGFLGGVVGLLVGLVMTVLVGSHLPAPRARERAFLVGFCGTGLFTFPLFTILFAFHPIGILIAFVTALAGGTLGYWLVSRWW